MNRYKLLLCLWAFFCFSCSTMKIGEHYLPPVVVAHRGGVSLAPENSLLAIERAMALGVDAVEVDVRLSADGVPVVIHDATVNRTTNGKGRVCNFTHFQLASLNLLDSAGCVTELNIPTLADVLYFVNGRCCVLVDAKEDSREIARAVTEVICSCGAQEWVAVQSFSDSVLMHFKELGVCFPLEKLFLFKFPLLPYIFDSSVRRFSMKKYSHISSFNIKYEFLTEGLVDKIHEAGKCVKAWTLGDGVSFFTLPVDGVITDFPQLW